MLAGKPGTLCRDHTSLFGREAPNAELLNVES